MNCSAEGCFQTFRTVSAYSSHVHRSHREQLGLSVPQETNEHDQRSSTFEYRFGKYPVGPDEIQYTIWHNLGTDSLHPQREAAKFLLKLKEVRHVSERTIGDVITGCKFLLSDSLSVVKASLSRTHFSKQGLTWCLWMAWSLFLQMLPIRFLVLRLPTYLKSASRINLSFW